MRRLLAPSLALVLASSVLLPPSLPARQAAPATEEDSTKVPKPARLFRSDEPVAMTLIADFKTVFKDRDSMSTKTYPGKLKYLGESGDTITLDVTLSTRGHFRLRGGTCAFPPLKVAFDKEQTRGGLFGGEGALKLSTHCRTGDRFTETTLLEYAANRMYSLLTPVALRARLTMTTWVDPGDPKFTVTRPGFWTEDEDEVARQVRGRVLMQIGGSALDMNPRQLAITELFNYMIGNTDFSLRMLHNYRIIQSDTSMLYLPMAYDFDWSGLVNAPYARPDYRLPIKRVTDRLWRGSCHEPAVLAEAVEHIRSKKDTLYGILRGVPGLPPARVKESIEYLDEFFQLLSDPGRIRREFRATCD